MIDFQSATIRQEIEELSRSLGEPVSVILEAEASPLFVRRFLALVSGGHTVMPLSSWSFRDEAFLRSIETEARLKFKTWALSDELPEGEGEVRKAGGRFIVRTSGSSGKFKLVLHDASLFMKKYQLIGKHFDRTFLFSPPDSIAGIETILEAFTTKASLELPAEKISPASVTAALKSSAIDYFQTTPSFLNLMMVSGKFREEAPPSLRKIAFGSEPAQEKVLRHIREQWKKVKLIQTYGMSEIGIQKTLETSDPIFFLLDEDVNPSRIVDGKLEIRSLTPTSGYLNAPDQFTPDGWFRTGDEAVKVGDDLKVSGREGDIINVAGKKFFPAELEEILMKLPDILDVTVTAQADELIGKSVTANILISPEKNEKEFRRALKNFLTEKVPTYMHPHRVSLLRESPESPRFKKMRRD